jgi:hypothetical protein
VISLAEGSVCVASAFTIATGKHIGDCDPAGPSRTSSPSLACSYEGDPNGVGGGNHGSNARLVPHGAPG